MAFKTKGASVQELLGIKTFTKYGIRVGKTELLLYAVSPTNISVLSRAAVEIKIRHLMMVLSAVPEIEISCTDASECFDDNKIYLKQRLENEPNKKIRELIKKDTDFLDEIQIEMSTARQFLFIARLKNTKDPRTFETANRVEKVISEQGFEVNRLSKEDIKRVLALYFDASKAGERIPDFDGNQYFDTETEKE